MKPTIKRIKKAKAQRFQGLSKNFNIIIYFTPFFAKKILQLPVDNFCVKPGFTQDYISSQKVMEFLQTSRLISFLAPVLSAHQAFVLEEYSCAHKTQILALW